MDIDQELAEDDLFGFGDFLPDDTSVSTPEARKRSKQPFKEATIRPTSRLVAGVGDSDLTTLFDGESLLDKRPLEELYVTLEDILAIKGSNGLKLIGSFTGCGGSLTGFAWSGWQELAAVEFVKAARDTLGINWPSYTIEPADVLKIAQQVIKEYGWQIGVGDQAPVISDLSEPAAVDADLDDFKEETEEVLLVEVDSIAGPVIDTSVPFEPIVYVYRQATVRKHVILGSLDWERTIDHFRGYDKFDMVDEFRLEVCRRSFQWIKDQAAFGGDKLCIWGDDIRGLHPQALLEHLGLEKGELDLYEGSPPCKVFSTAGLREAAWGQILHYSDERSQRADDLFYEYLRVLAGLMPRAFIAENVAGIGMGSAETQVMEPLIRSFEALGYVVEAQVLNARDYGVAQSRPRMIFQGIRTDQFDKVTGRPSVPIWPAKFSVAYTCQDVLDLATRYNDPVGLATSWLGNKVELVQALGNTWPAEVDALFPKTIEARKLNRDLEGTIAGSTKVPLPDTRERYETGVIWNQLEHGGSPLNKTFQLVRCHPDLPIPTITATSAGNVPAAGPCHPHEPRKFTIPELRAAFSFPQDYVFTGNLEQQGERMGRCVPPHMMKRIADTVAEILLRSETRSIDD